MRVVLLALCVAACSPAPPPIDARPPASPPSPPEAPGPVDMRGEWRLTAMNGRPAPAPDDADTHHPITMTVGDFTFRARSQCIAFWRRYDWQGRRLLVAPANPARSARAV
ncbi:hypothetical protein GCM10009116_01180 [Brevundimonas basaltis]|uniref:Lipocalin-like domain-containing protein n=1 Tax=Brevundimonas basaltis TaxID=472166 RepID=A0A7W8MHD5_9CAUL|nr:hypothetical protein [Brevundimonas basaltis]MBB5292860.1 hypothetical protein [Brevundimonas basaltis]